jgi:DNA-directed RNA polymerase specialized sigma24 family protein
MKIGSCNIAANLVNGSPWPSAYVEVVMDPDPPRKPEPSQERFSKIEATMRRVKRALYWGSSRDTADFVQGLLEKWIRTETYAEMMGKPIDELNIYRSARSFVIDHLRKRDALKRSAHTVPVEDSLLPSDEDFREMVLEAETLAFVRNEVANLERGVVRQETRKLLKDSDHTAKVLRKTMDGMTNSDIAKQLGIATGTVSKRLQEGSAYLAASLMVASNG